MSSQLRPPALGKKISDLRRQQMLSREDLARRSGVSIAMLNQIEEEQFNPTVATVWRIAKALNLNIQTILTEKNDLFEILRNEDAPTLTSEDGGCVIRITSPIHLADRLEMYSLAFRPGASLQSPPHYAGTVEFLTVLKGTFRVTSADRSATVGVGDTARYRADAQHAIENSSDGEGEAYLVVQFRTDE